MDTDLGVFLAYRRTDGEDFARLTHRKLDGWVIPSIDTQRSTTLRVFCDLFNPPTADFTEFNEPALRSGKSLIIIVTPGAALRGRPEDWLYKEIDWWLANRRDVTPIVLNTNPEDKDRWIPEPVRARWPRLNWIPLSLSDEQNSTNDVFSRIVSGVIKELPEWLRSEQERHAKEVEKERRVKRFIKNLLVGMTALLVLVLVVTFFALLERKRAADSANVAIREAQTALVMKNQAEQAEMIAVENLEIATKGMAAGLVEEGYRRYREEPSVALRLAEAAAKLSTSPRSGELFRSSLLAMPVWCEIGAGPDSREPDLIPTPPTVVDPFAVDKGLTLILGPAEYSSYPHASLDAHMRRNEEDFRLAHIARSDLPEFDIEKPSEVRLALRQVPSGNVVGALKLQPGELLLAPESSATRLFCTRYSSGDTRKINVYELSQAGITQPLLTIEDVDDVAFCNGDWPLYVLLKGGELRQYSHSKQTPRIIGKWSGVSSMFVHPKGGAIVLMTPKEVIWVGISEKATDVRPIKWSWPEGTSDELISRIISTSCSVRWGPKNHNVLLYRVDFEKVERGILTYAMLSAINANTQSVQTIARRAILANGLTRLICETDAQGNRVVTTGFLSSNARRPMDLPGSILEVFTLAWLPDTSTAVVQVKEHRDNLLRTGLPAATKASVRCAAVSPNGCYVVVGYDVRGTTGTQFGHGRVESWDLQVLDDDSTMKPTAIPIPYSNASVVRLAYSSDGRRIAIWDHYGKAYLYNVREEPSRWHRMPEPESDRYLNPAISICGRYGRFWQIDYGADDVRLFDLGEGDDGVPQGLLPKRLLPNGSLRDVGWCEKKQSVVVVAANRIVHIRDGQVLMERELSAPSIAALIGEDTISVLTNTTMTLYDSMSLEELGVVQRDKYNAGLSVVLHLMNSRHTDRPYRRSICCWHKVPDNTFIASIDQGNIVNTWQLRANGFGELSAVSLPDMAFGGEDGRDMSDQRHCLCRAPDGDIVFVARSRELADKDKSFRKVRWTTGEETSMYEAPPDGWPELAGIEAVRRYSSSGTAIVFRYSNPGKFNFQKPESSEPSYTGIASGVWSNEDGKCKVWRDLGRQKTVGDHPEVAYIEVEKEPHVVNVMLIGNNVGALINDNGEVLWSGSIGTKSLPHLPPYLQQKDESTWILRNSKSYEKALQTILFGGADRLDTLTTTSLPKERQDEIDQLTLSRYKLIRRLVK